MFERAEDLKELIRAQGGVAEAIVTKQVTFRTKVYLCFDRDRRETFVLTDEQWREAKERFAKACKLLHDAGVVFTPVLYVETETGKHFNWVWRPDGNYSEE